MIKKYYSVFGPALQIFDALILVGCWILAYFLRLNYPLPIMKAELPPFQDYWGYSILIVLLWGTVFSLSNLYSGKRMIRRTAEAHKVIRAHMLSLLIFVAITYLVSTYRLSRGVLVYFGFMSVVFLVLARLILRNTLRHLRAKGFNIQRVIILGTGNAAVQAYRKLSRHPELGLDILGFVGEHDSPELDGRPVLGKVNQTVEIVRTKDVQKVVIALSASDTDKLEDVLNGIKEDIVDVILVPDLYDHIALGCAVEDFDGLPMMSLNDTTIVGVNLFFKRVMDVFLASLAVLFLFPIMALLALFIKITSRGPVFYTQDRMSINGRSFKMFKFRSMKTDQAGDVEILTKKDDPRVTRIGKLMRKTSLDEVPQFFNVIRGDMSIVGPRPERTWVVDELRSKVPRYMLKHKVKAGITGWAQVNGWRGDTSLDKRIEYDLYYIKNWSVLFDLKILALTVLKGFTDRNAY